MKIKFCENDKGKVLATLYNNSKPLGMGFLHFDPAKMTEDEANTILKEQTYFDYLKGRVMKVNLESNEFDPCLYDRDNGTNSAKTALENANIAITIQS